MNLPIALFFLIDAVWACLPTATVEETTTTAVTSTSYVTTTATTASTATTMTTASMATSTVTVVDPCGGQCPDIYSTMCYGGYGVNCLDETSAMVMITYDAATLTCTLSLNCPSPQYTYVQDAMSGMQTPQLGLMSITCTTSPPNGWIVPATMQSIDGIVCNDFF